MHIGSNFEKHAGQFKNAVVLSLVYARLWSFCCIKFWEQKDWKKNWKYGRDLWPGVACLRECSSRSRASLPNSSSSWSVQMISCSTCTRQSCDHIGLLGWVGLVSCPTPRMPPGEKWSSKQTQISWAYYPKMIRTNEIGRSVIITQHFPYNSKICSSLFEYLYYFWADCPQNVLNIARLHCHKRVLAQEIQLDSPDYFSLWEGGVWGRG